MKIQFHLFLIFLFFSCSSQTHSGIEVLDGKSFESKIASQEIQLVDVRTPEEFAEGTIAHAENIDFYADDFLSQFDKYDKEKDLYIFCRSGGRSGKASKMLSEIGFKKVYDLKGGYSQWGDR